MSRPTQIESIRLKQKWQAIIATAGAASCRMTGRSGPTVSDPGTRVALVMAPEATALRGGVQPLRDRPHHAGQSLHRPDGEGPGTGPVRPGAARLLGGVLPAAPPHAVRLRNRPADPALSASARGSSRPDRASRRSCRRYGTAPGAS